MKRIIFGGVSAILGVISFSGFKTVKTTGPYYWFSLPEPLYSYYNNPTIGDLWYRGFSDNVPFGISCAGGEYYCIVGYTYDQVFTGGISFGHQVVGIRTIGGSRGLEPLPPSTVPAFQP
jgi:hypothetical protein